jgi:hypothetical protein
MRGGAAGGNFLTLERPAAQWTETPLNMRLFAPPRRFELRRPPLYRGQPQGGGAQDVMTTINPVSLDDKYDLTKDRIFVTGYQALIRLCLMQMVRDRRGGLNPAVLFTGYRGSPLGVL